MKSLNEKWLIIVQSTRETGESEIGGSSTVTDPSCCRASPYHVPCQSNGDPRLNHMYLIGSPSIQLILLNPVDLCDLDSLLMIRTCVSLCISSLFPSHWLLPSCWQMFRQLYLMIVTQTRCH